MSILSLNEWIASAKQSNIVYHRTASRTTIAAFPFTLFELAGNPGPGALAVGNTANGIVPVQGQAGYPALHAFGGGNLGYITGLWFRNNVLSTIDLFDRVFACGAYAFNADVTLTAQPSFGDRMPDGSFVGTEIWVDQVTAATGNQAVNVTYTNQAGVTGRTTGAVGIGAAPTLGRAWQLPLQAGDSGVQRIERVVGSVATAGTFNVSVLRRLAQATVLLVGQGEVQDLLRTGMVQVFANSALYAHLTATGTSSGVPELRLQISNG